MRAKEKPEFRVSKRRVGPTEASPDDTTERLHDHRYSRDGWRGLTFSGGSRVVSGSWALSPCFTYFPFFVRLSKCCRKRQLSHKLSSLVASLFPHFVHFDVPTVMWAWSAFFNITILNLTSSWFQRYDL